MITADPAVLEGLTYAHYVWVYGVIVGGPDDGLQFEIESGSLEMDAKMPVRRYGTARLVAPTLWTDEQNRALSERLVSSGAILRVEWVMTLMDQRSFVITVGTLRIDECEVVAGGGVLAVAVYDLGVALSDDRFLTPRSVTTGTTTKVGALTSLLAETTPYASLAVDPAIVDASMPTTTWDQERDAACADIAQSLAGVLFWGNAGGWVLRPVTDGTEVDWSVARSLSEVSSLPKASRQETYNAVVAVGQVPAPAEENSPEQTTPPPTATAYDDDPASPTYWQGTFGRKPRFYESPLLTTDAQCLSAAQSILTQSKGLTRSMTFDIVANPLLEPGDCIELTGETPAPRFLVDKITLPLGTGPMKLDVRQVA